MRRSLVLWIAPLFVACASHPPPPAATPGGSASAAASAAVASAFSNDDLAGVWVEYWALTGKAETQRYAFFTDGRFGWRAPDGGATPMARRWGRFKLTPRADETALELSVQGHEERFGCEGMATRRIVHDPPLEDRLVLGECPPNEEARALDPSYRCLGIAGHAFWRLQAAPDDPTAFYPEAK